MAWCADEACSADDASWTEKRLLLQRRRAAIALTRGLEFIKFIFSSLNAGDNPGKHESLARTHWRPIPRRGVKKKG